MLYYLLVVSYQVALRKEKEREKWSRIDYRYNDGGE